MRTPTLTLLTLSLAATHAVPAAARASLTDHSATNLAAASDELDDHAKAELNARYGQVLATEGIGGTNAIKPPAIPSGSSPLTRARGR